MSQPMEIPAMFRATPGKKNAIVRFCQKVRQEGDCLIWTGTKAKGTTDLYGRFNKGKSRTSERAAHRFAYEYFRGPIPAGLVIDHLCRNTLCVNPWHLEPVTNKENVLRGMSFSAVNKKKTHCRRGHEFTPENIYPKKNGRDCRECIKIRNRNDYGK